MVNTNDKAKRFSGLLNKLYARTDFIQIMAFSLLITIGILFIYGTGQQVGSAHSMSFWVKQVQWLFVGICCWLFFSLIDYKWLRRFSWVIYAGTLVLLVAVLVFGLKIYGARRWLSVGPLRLQPSEFAKLGVMVMLSWAMTMRGFNINKWWHLLAIAPIVGIPFLLILMEPDLGSALVMVPITAAIIFASNFKWKFMAIGIAIVLTLGVLEGLNEYYKVMPLLKDYQLKRIEVFLHPEKDIKNRGWNQLQSLLAVGSGGMYGKGYMQGNQNQLGFLPQTVSNTDFIFSVIAEETGFIGIFAVITLYILLIFSILRTAVMAKDRFGQYLACGTAAMLFMHTFVNIGMTIGVMPITGLPLPLVSYGGSFMVSTMIYLGIMQSIYAQRRPLFAGHAGLSHASPLRRTFT